MSTPPGWPEHPQPDVLCAPRMTVPTSPSLQPRDPAPLSQFTHRRRVLVFVTAFTLFVGLASALGNLAGNKVASLLTGDEGIDFASYTWPTSIMALIVFTGGVWRGTDTSLVLAGKHVALRMAVTILIWTSVIGFGGAFTFLLLLLTLLLGNPDALPLMAGFFVTLLVISFAAIPAVIVGEIYGGPPPLTHPAQPAPPHI